MATQPTINELFGSDSEDEDEQVDAQVSARMSCMFIQMLYITCMHMYLRNLSLSTIDCRVAPMLQTMSMVSPCLPQAPEASEQPVSGAWPVEEEGVEDEDAPERGKARNINTGEPQYQEALLRKRIGESPSISQSRNYAGSMSASQQCLVCGAGQIVLGRDFLHLHAANAT